MVPKLMALHTDANYLHRLTPLLGIASLGGSLPVDGVRRQFVPVLATLSKDKVANVRMNVAKAIQACVPTGKTQPDLMAKYREILTDLEKDADDDVKFFSRRALNTLN